MLLPQTTLQMRESGGHELQPWTVGGDVGTLSLALGPHGGSSGFSVARTCAARGHSATSLGQRETTSCKPGSLPLFLFGAQRGGSSWSWALQPLGEATGLGARSCWAGGWGPSQVGSVPVRRGHPRAPPAPPATGACAAGSAALVGTVCRALRLRSSSAGPGPGCCLIVSCGFTFRPSDVINGLCETGVESSREHGFGPECVLGCAKRSARPSESSRPWTGDRARGSGSGQRLDSAGARVLPRV